MVWTLDGVSKSIVRKIRKNKFRLKITEIEKSTQALEIGEYMMSLPPILSVLLVLVPLITHAGWSWLCTPPRHCTCIRAHQPLSLGQNQITKSLKENQDFSFYF